APWTFDNDLPQLRGITVKNLGKTNHGENGDVAIGFFKPLEGPGEERWLMITNALADRAANAAQCTQKIVLNLVVKQGTTVQKANRTNGKLEAAALKKVGEADRYLLELELTGGSGDLICLKGPAGGN